MRHLATATVALLTLAACSATSSVGTPTPGETAPETSDAPEEYPDAALRAFWRAMNEPRPVENSAMPPRHFNEDWFPELLVERTENVHRQQRLVEAGLEGVVATLRQTVVPQVELHQLVQTLDRCPPSHGLQEPLGELWEFRIQPRQT